MPKSTSVEFGIEHIDAEDKLLMIIDAKDPQRQAVMQAVRQVFENAQRNDDAAKAKAYAADKLPDDWRRKAPATTPEQTGSYRKPDQ